MPSPDYASVLELYQRSLSMGALEYWQQQAGLRVRRGIYAAQVVLWLMIVQRLEPGGTLARPVQELRQGIAEPLLSTCKRVKEKRVSGNTGGYCRARQKLPKLLCRQVMREYCYSCGNCWMETIRSSAPCLCWMVRRSIWSTARSWRERIHRPKSVWPKPLADVARDGVA